MENKKTSTASRTSISEKKHIGQLDLTLEASKFNVPD
jgi:hypothetical protein